MKNTIRLNLDYCSDGCTSCSLSKKHVVSEVNDWCEKFCNGEYNFEYEDQLLMFYLVDDFLKFILMAPFEYEEI